MNGRDNHIVFDQKKTQTLKRTVFSQLSEQCENTRKQKTEESSTIDQSLNSDQKKQQNIIAQVEIEVDGQSVEVKISDDENEDLEKIARLIQMQYKQNDFKAIAMKIVQKLEKYLINQRMYMQQQKATAQTEIQDNSINIINYIERSLCKLFQQILEKLCGLKCKEQQQIILNESKLNTSHLSNLDSTYLQNIVFTPNPSLDISIKIKEDDFQDVRNIKAAKNNGVKNDNDNSSMNYITDNVRQYQMVCELYGKLVKDPQYLLSKHNVKLDSQTVLVYQQIEEYLQQPINVDQLFILLRDNKMVQ